MRSSGILMPVFSLPSRYGIGTVGREAYRFVDFLAKAGQSWWQVLPVGPTGFGDSPYQSFSAFAGNPYFIDLDMLCEKKLLERDELDRLSKISDDSRVDYAALYEGRFAILRRAAERFLQAPTVEYKVFCRFHAGWLDDYALFMAIKDSLNGCSFDCWEPKLRDRDPQTIAEKKAELASDVDFYRVLQFFFDRQWNDLHSYAKKKGISLIGDIPIYTAYDSADVWANSGLFFLDDDRRPTVVAGCPPDAFSEDGQLWGNPLFRWEKMKGDGYLWWQKRIKRSTELFDLVRIDHFRAFSAYYSIPAENETAAGGAWVKGPGMDFFDQMSAKLGKLPLIAEDLGTLDDDVRALLKQTGFPGMKVLQFAFDPEADSDYLPHNIGRDCIVYTGTHDNDTAVGYSLDGDHAQVAYAKEYLRIGQNDAFNWAMIRAAMASPANVCILQMQDLLGLDNTARINTPATAQGNWCWRIDYSCINDWLAQILFDVTKIYRRLPEKGTSKKTPQNGN